MTSQTSRHGDTPQVHVEKTPYANAYQSRYTEEVLNAGGNEAARSTPVADLDVDLLRHVNCGYLSTHGHAPTLLALKQHAQALAILIAQIAPTTQYAEVDNQNNRVGRIMKSFRDNEAFDWLNDLRNPYQNDDEWHHKPLTDLMNKIQHQSDTQHTIHHCPLQEHNEDKEKRTKPRPYASHAALAFHANECLEVLDHEYGATGGLLSLLPTDAETDSEEMSAVRNSLLGQWLLFGQHLVARMHDLELGYANALDVTAGEAAVPMQMLSKMGPDASSGREIAFPQDKWILANAGDDVSDYLHRVLDREEAQIQQKKEIWMANGTYGERMWNEQRGGDLYARGLVFYDVKTRYYRLQGKGKSTIFILPAHGEHPAVQQTRRLELTPTVVSVVTPTWPARVSDWESKYKSQLDEATRMEIQNHRLTTSGAALKEHNETLATELEKARFMNEQFETYYGRSESADGPRNLERAIAVLQKDLRDKTDELKVLEMMVKEVRDKLPGRYGGFFADMLPEEPEGAISGASVEAAEQV
ncbi:hypothetical protein CORC01_09935 [Colletotrichum orchidophilum]|uniref:Uncharacterized protein n=1 Tax=Colletotrichum orchidophilum TaxID=1209926 RepID=A0A1G4AZX6_9PEZI|nr:uncharacterized protein CORC01_09935 [Colletotrichum orchidophilum]OHE94718.1 hypothetical protein CORC01_09935 [Colletotrichum orchidophilum]